MKKRTFASQLLQTVDNSRDLDNASDEEIVDTLCELLSTLEPKDKKNFAQWGLPKEQTTPDKCWD